MIIAVDAGCLGIKDKRLEVGVYHVVKNLLLTLSKQDKVNTYILYSFSPVNKNLLKEFGLKMKNIVVTPTKGWLKVWVPLQLLRDKPDIFLALNQAAPLKLPFSHYKTIGFFYDMAFIKYPHLYSYAGSVKKLQKNSSYLASTIWKAISISESTKKDIMDYYKIPSRKIRVAYPGVDYRKNIQSFTCETPYFLFVGALKKSKNIPLLVRAFTNFLKKSNKQFKLFIVGGDRWLDPEIQKTIVDIPREYTSSIQFLGYVNDKKLFSLYKYATAFVSPSIYEGFGLPLVEAMSQACPVIAGNTGAQREVVGQSGILVDPFDECALTRAMVRISKDSIMRKKLSQIAKEQSLQYSWEKMAKIVYNSFYEN